MTNEVTAQPMTAIQKFNDADELKKMLAGSYMKQISNFFGDNDRALRFLSGVMAATQRNPKLLECTPTSVINSFMTMAQLQLMPSDVSGEAYVIPYNNSKKNGNEWIKIQEAQFQLGYQGLVTLFYRAGVKEIVAEIVREKDQFSFENGVVNHKPDVFADDRGAAKGAYVIVTLPTGGRVTKVMSKKEIMFIASKFSKSYASKSSPWEESSDPQGWMWKKTVLKQAAKLVPKNDAIATAIAEDNKDGNIDDPKPTFNLEECEQKLLAVKNQQELASVWAALPMEAKLELKDTKDEMKTRLIAPATINVEAEKVTAEISAPTESVDDLAKGVADALGDRVVEEPKKESPAAKKMREGMEKVKTA